MYDDLLRKGQRPYLITYPKSEVLGAFGYIVAANEIREQLRESLRVVDRVVVAAVGASYAGLLLGLRLLGVATPVTGFAPLHGEYDIGSCVSETIVAVADRLRLGVPDTTLADIDIRYDHVGAGYAVPSREGTAALLTVAHLQGVLLDPVYTAKALAGLRDIARSGETLLFIHTGGSPALFAYGDSLLSNLG
jgi:1-aminocyclopropane-1-carboxylate deaminase/D-cysteine desulfhydrase-like pyridoxal-dependent ACC family enzyme